ncbi:MAG: 2-dehydropantoate 2-reductase N-terminal domain-containing protein [Mycobacteriaceae bacterium]
MADRQRTVAVVGAGVIGQVYAGRLAAAGHQVWLLARGATFAALSSHGVRLRTNGMSSAPAVTVVDSPADVPAVDVVYLAVRADQVDSALPVLAQIHAPVVVTLVNLADRADAVATTIGADRVVIGFAGVGGSRTAEGVTYQEIGQQATTIGRAGGREDGVVADLRATGLTVDVVADMTAWLATHTIFIAGVSAAILEAGGSGTLGNDRARTNRMVLAVREGFAALSHHSVTPTPTPLSAIFTVVPRIISVPYWQRQMRGDLGRLSLSPHVLATRDSELPHLATAARRITRDSPRLDAALTAAGLPSDP